MNVSASASRPEPEPSSAGMGVWLRLGRVSNLPTVWTNAIAGVVLAGTVLDWPALLALCAAFSAFYVGGMFLNDAFDAEIDARERPDRPIPSGEVTARSVFVAGFGLLGSAILALAGIAWWVGGSVPGAAASGLVLAGLIAFYDAYHKDNPLSPLVMGLCRVGVYAGASLSVAGTLDGPVLGGAACLLGYLIGLTYAAKQEALNRLRSLWPLAFLAAPVVYVLVFVPPDAIVLGMTIALVLWQLSALKFLWPGTGRSVPGAIVRLIAGISILDAVLISTRGELALALVAFALCGVTRLLQQRVPGT